MIKESFVCANQEIHGDQGIMILIVLHNQVKRELRKETVNNRESYDQEGSSTQQNRGDVISSNRVPIIVSLLRHSNRRIS